jgi:hypothetical protein
LTFCRLNPNALPGFDDYVAHELDFVDPSWQSYRDLVASTGRGVRPKLP